VENGDYGTAAADGATLKVAAFKAGSELPPPGKGIKLKYGLYFGWLAIFGKDLAAGTSPGLRAWHQRRRSSVHPPRLSTRNAMLKRACEAQMRQGLKDYRPAQRPELRITSACHALVTGFEFRVYFGFAGC
jgi:Ser/Thr protein kinase RdoA (MazF antagonist)